MRRAALFVVLSLLFCVAGFLLSLNGCGGGNTVTISVPPPASKIQHVVIIFQENRTPDNLFQDPVLIKKRRGYPELWSELERPNDPAKPD